MEKHPEDFDLDFLYSCTNEELDLLVQILLNAATNMLDIDEGYKRWKPNHRMYIDSIIADYQTFGGNSIVNAFRGHGVPYLEILSDVCDQQDVDCTTKTLDEMENALLSKSLTDLFAKMSDEQKREVLQEIGGASTNLGSTSATALITAFRMGGFSSYKVMLMLVNGLSKLIIGRGLAFGANAALTRTLSIVTGPIGWTIGGLWTAIDIASPAYRVTVPATIYIAALRNIKRNEELAKKAGAVIGKCIERGEFARAPRTSLQA